MDASMKQHMQPVFDYQDKGGRVACSLGRDSDADGESPERHLPPLLAR